MESDVVGNLAWTEESGSWRSITLSSSTEEQHDDNSYIFVSEATISEAEHIEPMITVEPLLFIAGLLFGVFGIVLKGFLFHQICVGMFLVNVTNIEAYCIELQKDSAGTRSQYGKVQAKAIHLQIALAAAIGLSSLLSSLVYAAVSDKYGRKPVILISLSSQAFWLLLALICAELPEISLYYLAAGIATIGILTGGLLTLTTCCFVFLVDHNTVGSDASQLTIGQSVGSAAFTIGTLAAIVANWLSLQLFESYSQLFLLSLLMVALGIVYTALCIKDKCDMDPLLDASIEPSVALTGLVDEGRWTTVKDGFRPICHFVRLFTRDRVMCRRTHLIVASLVYILFYSFTTGLFVLEFVHLKQSPFNWSPDHNNLYAAAKLLSSAASVLTVLLLKRQFRWTDLEMMLMSVAVSVLSWTWIAFSVHDWMVYIGGATAFVTNAFYPVCRAFIATQVDRTEIASAFSVILLPLQFGPISLSVVLKDVYFEIKPWFMGSVFALSAFCLLPMLIALCALWSITRVDRTTDNSEA